ncbi:MAG: AMP-binding protein [Fibrobacteria bacterium]
MKIGIERLEKTGTPRLAEGDDPRFRSWGWGIQATPSHAFIHDAIDAQIRLRPLDVAIEHEGRQVTYRELDRLARRVSSQLAAHRVGRGDVVGIFARRGIPMVASILGVLRLGAAYAPMDVGIAPMSMLQQAIDSTGMRVAITTGDGMSKVAALTGAKILIYDLLEDPEDPEDPARNGFLPNAAGSPDDSCFVLFTSGTTGTPNAVAVSHRNVCNLLLTSPGNLGICPGMRVGQILAIGFDMAAWEILVSLSHGATLCIRGADIAACAAKVNALIATPSILARLRPEDCPHIEVIALAGEPCPQPLAERWAASCRFHIGCGPTEVTIVNTLGVYRCGDAQVNIGRPTPNNTVYVLDNDLRPCAIGETGEMWAGGDCVSLGYVNNEILSQERYRPDPFLGGGRRMFRTRDLGRWLPDGSLEHLGRVDDQVKVRGFRVELDSVTALIESTPGCLRATTLKATDRDLVSFITPMSADTAAALARVNQRLPYYCVPARIIALPELPITPRGKVDKQVLMELAMKALAELSEEPV